MGLGMAALGRPGYINLGREASNSGIGPPEVRTVEVMRDASDAAMRANVRLAAVSGELPWFDCARSYGRSEEFVGNFFRKEGINPSEVYVSSKWGYSYVAGWKVSLGDGEPHEVKDHSLENFNRQVLETAEKIGDEYLNLYQVHSATFESGILTDTAVHEALHRCRQERGWALGLSVSGPRQSEVIREAMKIFVDGERLFDSVQCTFNVLEQAAGEALTEARDAGMDVVVKEGLANGRALLHPALVAACEAGGAFAGVKPDQLALAAVAAQPFRPRVLSGAVLVEHLESNLGATDVAKLLEKNPLVLKNLMEACKLDSSDYWTERSALAWN